MHSYIHEFISGFVTEAKRLSPRRCLIIALGSAILSFGLYNVHSHSGVTEGGVLGMTLLLDNLFGISPAVSGLIINFVCYFTGWKVLGASFILYSAVAGESFSLFYAIFEQFPPLWQELEQMPLAASIIGALFVGVGAGLGVRCGGASGGDDALAMALSHRTGAKIETIYLFSDLTVLALSTTYIPLKRLAYSLLTVILSGRIIGIVERFDFSAKFGKQGKGNNE